VACASGALGSGAIIAALARRRHLRQAAQGGKASRASIARLASTQVSASVRGKVIDFPRSKVGDDRVRKSAQDAWGGGPARMLIGDAASHKRASTEGDQFAKKLWRPDMKLWDGYVSDADAEVFGGIGVQDELDVLTNVPKSKRQQWVRGIVVAVDRPNSRVAVRLEGLDVVSVDMHQGLMRREEDSLRLCSEKDLSDIVLMRAKGDFRGLLSMGKRQKGVAVRSRIVSQLCRLGKGLLATKLVFDNDGGVRTTLSSAIRELAHELAVDLQLSDVIRCVNELPGAKAGQLLIEASAVALTAVVQEQRYILGQDEFLQKLDNNEAIEEVIDWVKGNLRLLEKFEDDIRRYNHDQKGLGDNMGLTEALNELVRSCSRAASPTLAFRTVEWMDRLKVPKDGGTYNAIGMNVVRRVERIGKVYDLPLAPEESCPEVVFAGRSNVGKSSLVNMLMGRKTLAPTSQKPGKTRTIDFYEANIGIASLPRFRLVDVPGLGYARVSKDLRDRWVGLISGYFAERKTLKMVFHLIDASLGEILPSDRDVWQMLAQAAREDYEVCIALTKADGTTPASIERFAGRVREELRSLDSRLMDRAKIFGCSAKTRLGKDTLWRKIWTSIGADSDSAQEEDPSVVSGDGEAFEA